MAELIDRFDVQFGYENIALRWTCTFLINKSACALSLNYARGSLPFILSKVHRSLNVRDTLRLLITELRKEVFWLSYELDKQWSRLLITVLLDMDTGKLLTGRKVWEFGTSGVAVWVYGFYCNLVMGFTVWYMLCWGEKKDSFHISCQRLEMIMEGEVVKLVVIVLASSIDLSNVKGIEWDRWDVEFGAVLRVSGSGQWVCVHW